MNDLKKQSEPFSRRGFLQVGSLSLLAPSVCQAVEAAPSSKSVSSPKRSCIFMHLQGGPSHLDLWDLKPQASAEVRGTYQTIDTPVPGIQFGELMQGTSRVANHLAVIRGMTHKFTNHIAGTYVTLTGSDNQQDRDREAHADDFPGPAAILNYLEKTDAKIPRSISLPSWLSIPGPSNRMPGQYAGFLGGVNDPFLIKGEIHQPDFKPLSLTPHQDLKITRLQSRLQLFSQLDQAAWRLESQLCIRYDHLLHSAYNLVTDGRFRKALDIGQEPDSIRDRYGRNKLGQSLLMARRLVEAGVQFVGFNEFNQKWDTHGGLVGRYNTIVPEMDQGYSALVKDLADRGMLDSTLVVNAGEFGRTPVINKQAGRDHWPNAYTTVLAGGGIQGGQILGATDNKGAEVTDRPTHPSDILATMWQQLGINPKTEIIDRVNRPYMVSTGQVISELL
ncbi:MAG: DUF1501 domain-containing protein [Planctomycetaceae bacterium]|nr:DUF1501 domain-containing protein [Planctomycetaceae bacterium]